MAAGGGEYRVYPQRFSSTYHAGISIKVRQQSFTRAAISSMKAVPKFAVRSLFQESSAGLDPPI